MKKLAFIINVFREDDFHSGGEKLFFELVNRAINDGFRVDLYCTTYLSEKNILRKKLNKLTFLGHPKDFKYPKKIESFYNQVKTLTEGESYDCIISENIAPPIDVAVLQGHSLLHYHDNAGNIFSKLLFFLKKAAHIKAQKKWLKKPFRKIIVPSDILKNELIRNFNIPEEKFLVIHPGVDEPEIQPEKETKNRPFTFGISAPSFGKKGGYIFLKALRKLKEKNYTFRSKIIYPANKKNLWLRFLLCKYGLGEKAEFLDYQKDMSGFFASIDCVVMPSIMETFGLVATESMIRGKPAIISSLCGASNIIEQGVNGFVFDMTKQPQNDLSEKMEMFINKEVNYNTMSKAARKTALEYNWKNFYEKFREEVLKL